LDVARLKGLASQLGVTTISVIEEGVQVVFDETHAKVEPEAVLALVERRSDVRLVPPSRLVIRTSARTPTVLLDVLDEVLESLISPTGTKEVQPERPNVDRG